MTIVRRPSPFGELLSLRQAMDRLFEDSFVNPRTWGSQPQARLLPLDVYATPDEVVVEAAIPGVKPEDVQITVTGDTLTLSCDFADDRRLEDGSFLVQEISRGTFSRSLTLPNGLQPDKATADFDNGLLRLHVPKAEEVKPRQIKVNVTGNGQSQVTAGSPANSQGK